MSMYNSRNTTGYTKFLFPMTLLLLLLAVFIAPFAHAATKYDAALAKWTRKFERAGDLGGKFTLQATVYTSEYIENLMQREAENNLWTASELEDYKYNFLRDLNIDEYLPIYIEVEELGPTAHMNPFDEMISLWIGGKKYAPLEYDRRFNMPLQGKRDGMVFFPRYDEKTGKSLFEKDLTLRLSLVPGASPLVDGEVRLTWDVKAAAMDPTISGRASDRVEVDRLIKRLEKLSGEKADLERQLRETNDEIQNVNSRIDELQKN